MDARKRWVLVAIAAVWIAVAITSFASKDLISGSEQEHLNIAALINWLWGALATMSLARLARVRRSAPDSAWVTIGVGSVFIWLVVTLAAAFGPSLETGSDPTSIPFPAIVAPIAGMLLTRFLGEFVLEVPDEGTSKPKAHKDTPPNPGSDDRR